mmetsp:Transcript_78566/g.254000  ORF Transcript_78566/g.254000 Transcript_78566/m.254000 type:complete len:271 (-) Transcript_78566:594-1406(-)
MACSANTPEPHCTRQPAKVMSRSLHLACRFNASSPFVIIKICVLMPRRRSFLLGRRSFLLGRKKPYSHFCLAVIDLRKESNSIVLLSLLSLQLCNFLCMIACCLLSSVSRCRHCAPRMCAWSSVTQSTISSGKVDGKSASTPWHLFSTRYRCARRFCSSFRLWSCSRLKVASCCCETARRSDTLCNSMAWASTPSWNCWESEAFSCSSNIILLQPLAFSAVFSSSRPSILASSSAREAARAVFSFSRPSRWQACMWSMWARNESCSACKM